MTNYGSDISTYPDLDEACAPLTGRRVVAEAILRRLSTPRGGLAFYPDDGIDLRGYLSDGVDGDSIFALKAEIEAECEKDERVVAAEATLAYSPSTESLTAEVVLELFDGEVFALTLAVTSLTVELLTR